MAGYLATVRALKNTYSPEKRKEEIASDPISAILYRPLSFWLTPLFLFVGFSANATTVFSILIAFAMPFASFFTGNFGPYILAATGIFFCILDCVDGNIARLQSKSSTLGHMLDSLSSMFFWLTYMLSASILAFKLDPSEYAEYALYGGFILSLLYISHREVEDTYDQYMKRRVTWTPPAMGKSKKVSFDQLGKIVEHTYLFVCLPIAGYFDLLLLYFLIMAAYQCSLLVVWLTRLIRDMYNHSAD